MRNQARSPWHSDQTSGLLNCWHSYIEKQLHGTPVILGGSVRLLLAHVQGPLPSKQSNSSKGHILPPTPPMLQSLCASWDKIHPSVTSLLSLFGLIAGFWEPPPPVRSSVLRQVFLRHERCSRHDSAS